MTLPGWHGKFYYWVACSKPRELLFECYRCHAIESTPVIADILGTAIWCPYKREYVIAGCQKKNWKMYLLDLR